MPSGGFGMCIHRSRKVSGLLVRWARTLPLRWRAGGMNGAATVTASVCERTEVPGRAA